MPGKYGKNTHSLHLLLIAFAQHGLLEHAPVLHYTCIVCVVNSVLIAADLADRCEDVELIQVAEDSVY